MFFQMFLVCFLLLIVCCQLCEQGFAAQNQKAPAGAEGNTISDFFKLDDNIKKVLNSTDSQKVTEDNVNNIKSVFLVATDSVMVALAEVNYKNDAQDKINILAKYIEAKKIKWSDGALKNQDENLKVEATTEKNKKQNENTVIKSYAVVREKDKIHYITISNNDFEGTASHGSSADGKWYVRLVVGEVTNGSGDETEKKLTLTSSFISGTYEDAELKKLKTQQDKIQLFDGYAFVIGDKNIIFFMKGIMNDDEKKVTVVFGLEKDTDDKKAKSLNFESIKNCHPSFFQWDGEIIMTPTDESQCDNNKVMMFDKITKAFNECNKPIARLRDFLKDKNNFVNATIEVNNVLLFTQQKTNSDSKNSVYLWMSDGTRVSNAGTIVDDIGTGNTFYGSVLHTNKELFALYHTHKAAGSVPPEKNKLFFRRLTDQLKSIKDTLAAWNENKNKIKQLCDNTSTTRIPCFTDGVVGFLCGDKEGNTNDEWKNQYSNINAKISGGVKGGNAYKFNKEGAGAQWPANAQGQNQPYNFTDPGFALVATVAIDEFTTDNDNSILGFCTEKQGTKKHIGLWCTKEGKWSVSQKGSALKVTGEKCNKDTTYQVALILQAQTLSVYIDGKNIALSQSPITVQQKDEKITHFYFGAHSDEAQKSRTNIDTSHVTVTNVLLYNRPFNENELNDLKKYVKPVEIITTPDNNKGTNAEGSTNNTGSGSDEKTTLPASPTGEEKFPSPSRTEDGGVGGGVRVFSLLLAVLCVSAPLLHL